jgi:hypothetical protein
MSLNMLAALSLPRTDGELHLGRSIGEGPDAVAALKSPLAE